MPRILCIGNEKGKSGRVGNGVAYKVAGVHCTAQSRYKAVLLPFGDDDLVQEDVVVDAVIDLSKGEEVLKDASFEKVPEALIENIQSRHNNTFVLHGLRGTGKTAVLQHIFPHVMDGVSRHIDTSGREAKSRREQLRQQQQQEQLRIKKELEQQEQIRLQARLKSAELRAVAEYTDMVLPQAPTPLSRGSRSSRASSASIESPRRTSRRESAVDKKRMLEEIDRRLQSLEQKGLIHTPIPPVDTPKKQAEKLTPVHPVPPKGPKAPARPPNQRVVSFTAQQLGDPAMDYDDQQGSLTDPLVLARTPETGGRLGASPTLVFSPQNETCVWLPCIDDLENTVHQCMVECWLRTTVTDRKMALLDITDKEGGCKLAVHLNANTYDELSPGVIRLQVCDSLHKSAEGHVLYDGLFDGDWHLLQCHVVNSRENKLDIRIDGMETRLFTNSQSDEPFSFASWQQVGCLGAEAAAPFPSTVLTSFFDGCIAEFRAWDMSFEPRRPLARLALNEGSGTEVKEQLTLETATVHNGDWEQMVFPPSALRLSGFNAINIGTLGDFGSRLRCFGVELWMRTRERGRPMSLLKVTDSQKKHMALGITLNYNGKGMQADTVTFSLRDAAGTELVCVWQPPAVHELTDGMWHNIQWKVSDSTTNSCFVKVDGKVMDVKYLSRGGPSVFLPLKDYVTVGAHNNRGKTEECFEGMLRHVVLLAGEGIVGVWDLNEGPGARLALDSGDPLLLENEGSMSGLHHGIHFMMHATHAPKPHKLWTEWVRCDLPDVETTVGALKHQQDKKELAKWATNTVRMACLAVEPVPKQDSNLYIEQLRDVRHDEVITLCAPTPSPFRMNDRYRDKASVFERLPETAWELLDNTEQVLEYFDDTFEELEAAHTPKSHHIWILCIGDAVTTFVDLAGISQPVNAVYDPRTSRWFSATTSIGKESKCIACLNRGSAAVAECLAEVGSYPVLWLRNTEHPIPFAKWEDSYITRVIRTYGVVESDEWSHLYFVHATAPERMLSKVEFNYSKATLDSVGDSSRKMAANSLQKLVMRARAKTKSRALKRQLIELTLRRKQSQNLLQEYPSAGMKTRRLALIVAPWRPVDERLPPICEVIDNANRVSDVLSRLGYEVIVMQSQCGDEDLQPTTANVLRKIQEVCDDDVMVMVYVCARGGGKEYTRPALFTPPKMWAQEEEEELRENITEEEQEDRAALWGKEHQERLRRKGHRQSMAVSAIDRGISTGLRMRSKSTGTRLVAGSGGAGKMKRHQAVGKEKREEQIDIVIVHAGERANALQEEAISRAVVDELELKHRNQIVIARQELETRERNLPPPVPYLLLDDTPFEADPENTLSLQQLSNAVIPQSVTVGIHRALVVDTVGWKSCGGWYAVQASSGEQLQGDYGIEAHGTMTPCLLDGLWGSAQLEEGPLILEEERERITLSTLMDFLAKCAKPSLGIKQVVSNCNGKLVGDAVVCPSILRTPEKAKEEAATSRDPATTYQTMRQFWLTVSVPPSFDSCSDDAKEQLRAALAEVGQGPVEHLMTYHCPWISIVFDTSLENLRPSTVEAIVKDAKEVSGEEVECVISAAPLWSDASEGFTMKTNESACARLTLKGVDTGDLRWTMPHTAARKEHDTTFRFANAMRRKFEKDTVLSSFGATGRANAPRAVSMKYHLFIRYQAPSPVVVDIVNEGRRGAFRQHFKTLRVDEVGAFTPQETAAFEKQVTMELERNRQSLSDKRRKQLVENRVLRAKERSMRATAEATERIQSKLDKIRESDKNITAPDLKTCFSLQDGGMLVNACDTLLAHTSVPYLSPGKPGLASHAHAPKGVRYVKQLVDWGLWDVVKAVLDAGTGNEEGEDDPAACAAMLKLVCGTVVLCGQQFVGCGLGEAVLRVMRRHSNVPDVVRWGFGIVAEVAEGKTAAKRPAKLLDNYEMVSLAVHCLALTANRRDAGSLIAMFTAVHSSLSRSTEETLVFSGTRLAVYTLLALPVKPLCVTDLDVDVEAAAQHLARLCFEIILHSAELQPSLIHRAVFGQPVLVGKTPFDAPIPPPQMSGPGVMVCSQCGERYTRTADGDCESSTLGSKKHAGPPADGEVQVVPNMEDYKEQGERAGVLEVVRCGLDVCSDDTNAVANGGRLLNYLLNPDTKLGAKLIPLLPTASVAKSFISTCLSDTCRGPSGELPSKVQAELVAFLSTIFTEIPLPKLRESDLAKYLKPKAIYIKRLLPTSGTRDIDRYSVESISKWLDSV